MYLPKHQYTFKSLDELPNVSGFVDELGNQVNIQGKNLIVTSFGAIFDRRTADTSKGNFTNAKALYPVPSAEQTQSPNSAGYEYLTSDSSERASFNKLKSTKLPPTSKDRANGVMKRYFHKNVCTGKVKELNKNQYIFAIKSKSNCDKITSIDWLINGPAKDQTINGYFLEGIESKNQKALDFLKKELPGAETLISSPLEYVRNQTLSTADPIRQQDRNIVIPSPGKRL